MRELVIDSFAGGGGASLGIAWATGKAPDVAINHDESALAMHEANHPSTVHFHEDMWKANPRSVTKGRKVGLLWASPDCKHFSRAKGGKPVSKNIRSLAWVVCKWAASVRPRMIILENVREFEDWGPLTKENLPCKQRKGLTFKRFVSRLRRLGYAVEWKTLNAADYGAPTHRRRLFLIARRDGQLIKWPEPTHAAPKTIAAMVTTSLKPWRTAAECIDWDLPCPSIFERKRPLAEKTMRRIALGIKRYVLEAAEPFIVGVGGRMGQSPPSSAASPMNTVTAKNDRAVVTPMVVPLTHSGERRIPSIEEPLSTITTAKRGEIALISPTLIQTGYGEREGQAPRVPGLDKPLGSVVAGGAKHALVAAFLAKHFGGYYQQTGAPLDGPMHTVTASDHHSVVAAMLTQYHGQKANESRCHDPRKPLNTVPTENRFGVVAANLVHLNHGEKQWNGCNEPLRTQTTSNHAALVYAFLVKYFGTAIGANLLEPAPTATGKDRFGLVTVTIEGSLYVIVDIGMRMLTPRELARAQGFPDTYELTGTKSSQVAKIGNSVCPMMAKVLVAANYKPQRTRLRKAVRA